jgi:hypothetical protein
MRFLYGDPGHLDDLAHRLDRRADEVALLGDEMVARAHSALWTSIAADTFRERIAHRHRDFDHAADAVRSAARETRRHAQAIRDEMAALRRIESGVREFLGTVTHLPAWARDLPVVGDVAWRNLGRLIPGGFLW